MSERETITTLEEKPIDLVMGSDSDRGIVAEAAGTLDGIGVGYNTPRIISAHRTYEELDDYAEEVRLRRAGLVIITFAGMSAALGGDMAARVPNTVIGVPLQSKKDTQNSAVGAQIGMPPGSGLVIVGPDQGTNAALAAVRALTPANPAIRQKMIDYQEDKRRQTVNKDAELQELGFEAWLEKYSPKQAS